MDPERRRDRFDPRGGECPKCELGAACVSDDDCDKVSCLEGACIDVRSCKTIHASDGELPDGVYPLDPDGQERGASFAMPTAT